PTPTMSPPSSANISTRDYIFFLGAYPLPPNTPVPYSTGLPHNNPLNSPPPSEPTSTLVLTSPNSTFIDIRILRPTSTQEKESVNEGGNYKRLEWGFAGTSRSYAIATPNSSSNSNPNSNEAMESGVTHSIWQHWLDSKHPLPIPPTSTHPELEYPPDEGDMYPLSNNQTLEHGHAFSASPFPGSVDGGRELAYEEMWSDVPILPTSSTGKSAGKKHCVVLRVEDLSAGVRGVVIRLGQYCQGILQQRDKTHVERWEFKEDEQGGKGAWSWKRTHKIGDRFFPCAVTFEPEQLVVGKVVTYMEAVWVVEELAEWD
ncbi:hypothetical protein BDV96DRAFT_498935, partial [Lophiotrema nucula]